MQGLGINLIGSWHYLMSRLQTICRKLLIYCTYVLHPCPSIYHWTPLHGSAANLSMLKIDELSSHNPVNIVTPMNLRFVFSLMGLYHKCSVYMCRCLAKNMNEQTPTLRCILNWHIHHPAGNREFFDTVIVTVLSPRQMGCPMLPPLPSEHCCITATGCHTEE